MLEAALQGLYAAVHWPAIGYLAFGIGLGIYFQPDELSLDQLRNRRIAERGRVEPLAPETAFGAEVEENWSLLFGGFTPGRVVIVTPRWCLTPCRGRANQ